MSYIEEDLCLVDTEEDTPSFRPFVGVRTEAFHLDLDQVFPADPVKKWVPYYHFKITIGGDIAGHVNFRLGNSPALLNYDGHIGYHIKPRYRGRYLSAKACRALAPFIRSHPIDHVILTCHPSNIASRKAIESLGAEFVECKVFHSMKFPHDTEKLRYRWCL